MNRKETPEQNDISIIIGNLPKRLQEKIITREGKGNSSIKSGNININGGRGYGSDGNINICTDGKGVCIGSQMAQAAMVNQTNSTICNPQKYGENINSNDDKVTSIDYFLRLTADKDDGKLFENDRPVSEASGSVTDSLKKMESEITKNVVVPGLIRLNAQDAKKMNECNSQELKNGLRNHDRRNRHHTRQEMISAKYDLPMSPVRHVQKLSHPSWFEALDDNTNRLPPLFDCLQNAINHNMVIENWSKLRNIRQELQDIFKNLLINNLKFCCEQKIDTFFWKILFYNTREYLKQQKVTNRMSLIQEVITEGIEFYEDIYKNLHKKYLLKEIKSSVENIQSYTNRRAQQKIDLIAKVTAQKLLIYLGDLWRYKIKDMQGQDYAEAAKYYQQAQILVPSNGVPYNQLAIVAIHNRKKFDAIYYHVRSLMSSNAIHSAKESLLVLFDEIRKKYEETELKSSPLHCNYNNNNNNLQSSKSMRKEVWIYPDGVRRLHRTDINGNNNYKMIVNEEKRFKEKPADELLHRVTSLYLYIIGKLYTGVGMETILEHERKFLLQLGILLQKAPLTITREKLMKILAINIFIIEHNLGKDTRRYHSINFCNQMFGLLLRKSNELLRTLNANPEDFEDQQFLDLNTVLQYIRIYILWLKHRVNLWEPIKNEDHIFINSWLELEKHFSILQQEELLQADVQNSVTFEEDIYFMGFTPLISIIPKVKNDSASEEGLQLKGRLKIIMDFKEIYCENQKRLESFGNYHFINEDLNSDIKQALDDLQSTHLAKADNSDDNENSENENEENYGEDIANADIEKSLRARSLKLCLNSNHEDKQLSRLSKLKKELEAKSNVKKMYRNKLEEILKFVDTKVYIEVRPKYLLPDTNCFIDCLEDFERIVNDFKRYTLIIPLTVVKELDGLSKGVKVESYEESLQKQRIHHYDDVSTRAKKSLDFIKMAKSHIRCATTKGSIINASLFALVEEEHVSNDDKILATAIALSKTMSSETSKDGKCFIQTELVLITTDRNLRVKALSRNLAVSELPEFLQWAKDCN